MNVLSVFEGKGNRRHCSRIRYLLEKHSTGSSLRMPKKTDIKREKKPLKRKYWAILSALIVLSVILVIVFSGFFAQPQPKFSMTAAIIDQLGTDFPDPSFVSKATIALQNYGFTVDYYNQSLDVSFFRTLASSNYGIIILRAHSALRNDSSAVDLFTSERYYPSSEKYSTELDNGLVTIGEFLYRPDEQYYTLSPLFIANLAGQFPKSIIIAMGCQSLKPRCEQMAQAFIDKGASAYIGWTDIVYPNDTDTETINVLDTLLNKNGSITDAVASTEPHTYEGLAADNVTPINVTSQMAFWPSSNWNLTIPQLVEELKPSLQSFTPAGALFMFSCLIAERLRAAESSHKKAPRRNLD